MITEEQARQIIAENLRHIMEARGLTQMDLAKKTGDSQPTISRIMRGANEPGISVVARVAEALETTLDYLIRDHRHLRRPRKSA